MFLLAQIQLHDHPSIFGVAEVLFAIAAEAGFTVVSRGGFCRFRGIASCAGIVGRSELVPGAAVVPSAHLFPAFLHAIVDPCKDYVPG